MATGVYRRPNTIRRRTRWVGTHVVVGAPANTDAPVVTGTGLVGQTLTTTDGTWTGSPTFTYQWQRSGVNIGSATASTYVLVDADDALNVRCVVTGTNGGGSASANSNAVAVVEPVPHNTGLPSVSGTKTVGQTLTSTTGTWTHQGGTIATYSYQWLRDAQGSGGYTNIGSATASTYVLVDADDACNLKCDVTATNSGGSDVARSGAYGLIAELIPANSVPPTISGGAPQGSVLNASTGTWTHQGGAIHTYSYQWTRDGTNIAGATGSSYTTQAADLTHVIGVKVTATNSGGSGTATASSNTITVTPPAVVTGLSAAIIRRIRRRRRG